MKIAAKFVGSSALLVMLVACLSGGSYWVNQRAAKSLGTIYIQSQKAAAAVSKLESTLQDELASLSRLAVLPEKSSEINYYRQQHRIFLEALDEFDQTVQADNSILRSQIQAIREQHQYLDELAIGASQYDISERQVQGLTRSIKVFEDSLNIYIQALLEHTEKQTKAYQIQSEYFYTQVAWLETLSLIAILLMLAFQFRCFLQPALQSLKQLQTEVDRMGRPSQSDAAPIKIQMDKDDELQSLAKAFNQMSDRLADAYQQLENRVAQRTESLHQTNRALQQEVSDRTAAEAQLKQTLDQLEQTQLQLLQTEKMSSLGQLVAGVAHEINNPVSFIQGNLAPAQDYVDSLIGLVRSYQTEFPNPSKSLQATIAQTDVDFIQADFPQLLNSMNNGADRITKIVRSLRTFSHLDESETKSTDLHEGLESTLLLLSPRLNATADRPEITIIRAYDQLPEVYCYPSQLNQVFMGILTNAIDAFTSGNASSRNSDQTPVITLTTQAHTNHVRICISDNGPGMSEAVRAQIFDPFFTTKPVGSGMGLGLAMSYQIIVANHRGTITCKSAPKEGSRFTIDIPLTLKIKAEPKVSITPEFAA